MASNKTISKNKFIQIGLNALRCCLDCFERLVRFINKQAFIQIGLTGKSFCPAAKDGFCVVVAHPIEFGLLSGLANLFMWLGNAMMVGGTLVICFIIMRNVESIDRNLSSPFWPLLVIFA
jgi:choline transporter-like protein 2/4/5